MRQLVDAARSTGDFASFDQHGVNLFRQSIHKSSHRRSERWPSIRSPNRPRYRFVVGNADEEHANKINEVNRQGYDAVLMTARSRGEEGGSVIVLMEREL